MAPKYGIVNYTPEEARAIVDEARSPAYAGRRARGQPGRTPGCARYRSRQHWRFAVCGFLFKSIAGEIHAR